MRTNFMPLQLVIAIASVVVCVAGSVTRAVTISGGSYTGTPGVSDSGHSSNDGTGGGPGYEFGQNGTDSITGGTFTGGHGGNATGGSIAVGGSGGPGIGLANFGVAETLTITGGSFNGGAAGIASGAADGGNVNGNPGDAIDVYGSSTELALIDGGTFQGQYDFAVQGSTIILQGQFVGGPQTITSGIGTFSGLLADNTTPETYSYRVLSGSLILEPVPEPIACASLFLPTILLMRRRQ